MQQNIDLISVLQESEPAWINEPPSLDVSDLKFWSYGYILITMRL